MIFLLFYYTVEKESNFSQIMYVDIYYFPVFTSLLLSALRPPIDRLYHGFFTLLLLTVLYFLKPGKYIPFLQTKTNSETNYGTEILK